MTLRENNDTITYETRPKYLKNTDNGRIFIATDALIALGTLVAVDGPDGEKKEAVKPTNKPFQLSKASKQQIIDEAEQVFGVKLSLDDTLKVLRASFNELKEKQDAGDNTNKSTG